MNFSLLLLLSLRLGFLAADADCSQFTNGKACGNAGCQFCPNNEVPDQSVTSENGVFSCQCTCSTTGSSCSFVSATSPPSAPTPSSGGIPGFPTDDGIPGFPTDVINDDIFNDNIFNPTSP